MPALKLDALPADILLLIVNKCFNLLSQEHSFWLEPLRTAQILRPIPCSTFDDLTARTTPNLKRLALRAVRLAQNWSQPVPQVVGPIDTFRCGVHNNILYLLPGTDVVVLYSFNEGTVICADVKAGVSSTPVFVGTRIFDVSSPLEEPAGFSVGALVAGGDNIDNIPGTGVDVVLIRPLQPGYIYTGIFMTSSVVGVLRAPRDGCIEVLSLNLRNPEICTVILTDRPRPVVLGSTVINDTVYFITLQGTDAFVYACPPRLLAYSEPLPETDYTIQRSHVARIPRPPDFPMFLPSMSDPAPRFRPITRLDYCVLSTEPNRGRNTISVARNVTTSTSGRQISHSLEITFWPRPAPLPAPSPAQSLKERERAEARQMQPAQTISIPGSLSNQPGTTWELLVIANSGLAIVLVVDPPEPEVDADADADAEAPAVRPAPKLMMARYDPVLHSVSLHELRIPAGTEKELPHMELNTRNISALAFDDHSGYVIVVTVHDVLHCIPYA
ncbi:hypothetical protein K438DRAFT_1816938 [Mycena galopus ATCC 62051]|nr:hypothetical protein K438DRAFT_1816938 [Mycena galopus ATCC 62051]